MNRFHRYYCARPGWARLVQTTLVPAVLEGAELGPLVLELGPGPGLTTEALAGVAPELTAIELDPALARATRDRVPTADMVQGDATTMPFTSRVPRPPTALAESIHTPPSCASAAQSVETREQPADTCGHDRPRPT